MDGGAYAEAMPGSAVDVAMFRRLQDSLGGPGSMAAFVDLFLHEGRQHVERMEGALARGDRQAVQLAAHSLKPTSGLLGAHALQGACRCLEEACRSGGNEELAPHFVELRESFKAVARELVPLAAALGPAAASAGPAAGLPQGGGA